MVNRPEFNLIDCAALHLGVTPFSIYNTSAPDQIEYVFSNAENRVVVVEGRSCRSCARRPRTGRDRADRRDRCDEGGTVSLERLEEMQESTSTSRRRGRRSSRRRRDPDLHVGDNRPAEGRPDHPQQRDGRGPRHGPSPDRVTARARDVIPAVGAHRRPVGLALPVLDRVRLHDDLGSSDPRAIIQYLPEVRPTLWGSGAAHLGEAQGRAGVAGGSPTSPRAARGAEGLRSAEKLGLDQVEALVVGAAPTPPEVLRVLPSARAEHL